MALLPLALLLSGESLISYMTRLVRCRAGRSLTAFLSFLGLRLATILVPDDPTLDRIADLSGTERCMLNEAAVLADRTGMRRYRREPFAAPFRLARMISFCPRCLLEDRTCSHTGSRRIGRQIWDFAPIRTCPRHGAALFRRHEEHNLEIVDLHEGGVYPAPELLITRGQRPPPRPFLFADLRPIPFRRSRKPGMAGQSSYRPDRGMFHADGGLSAIRCRDCHGQSQ
ncbi:TniQ family protein [Paenirhodobacter sp.]|uniref:TniQ family protein n=1 Tax=Paenirhodobacter sp. TaxID=1965326 RepID=UPI003B50D26D